MHEVSYAMSLRAGGQQPRHLIVRTSADAVVKAIKTKEKFCKKEKKIARYFFLKFTVQLMLYAPVFEAKLLNIIKNLL